ncbi:MAG TPA: hypothetical protein DCE20_08920 [Gammaproteobacteria bacterium]|nr:hypothetical protein [Gammaproteobacteria bacterium]
MHGVKCLQETIMIGILLVLVELTKDGARHRSILSQLSYGSLIGLNLVNMHDAPFQSRPAGASQYADPA